MPINIDRNLAEPLSGLEWMAKQTVEGFITGLHKSPFHGFSVEFAEHRLYNSGDSLKHLDWKLLARTDKMFLKRYEEETNLRCHVLIDVSNSMNFPEVSPRANEVSCLFLFSLRPFFLSCLKDNAMQLGCRSLMISWFFRARPQALQPI